MRNPFLLSALSVSGFALAAAALPAATLQVLPSYVADGCDYALGLADGGLVIGNAHDYESSAPVLWTKGDSAYSAARALALPASSDGGEVRWISADASLLAGYAAMSLIGDEAANHVPVVWSRSDSGGYTATVLPRLGGGASETVISGGSAAGSRFVGQSGAVPVATLWRGATGSGYAAQALALPSGAAGVSLASALSSSGARAVGHYETAAGSQAVVWTEHEGVYVVAKLQTLSGGAQGFAHAISRDGALAAGASEDGARLRPVTWNTSTGAATVLESMPGFEAAVLAIADNNFWFGGRATDADTFESSAVLWNSTGQIFDLVSRASSAGVGFGGLVPESVTGIHLVSTGLYTIVGTGINTEGATQGFVLENFALVTPIPEPETPDAPIGETTPTGVFLKRRQRPEETAPTYPNRSKDSAEKTLGGAGGRPRSR